MFEPGKLEQGSQDNQPSSAVIEVAAPSTPRPSMLNAASGTLGSSVVQRKLVRRLAERRASHADGMPAADVQEAAERGLQGGAQALPHLDRIQASFGHHDVSGVNAHVGGPAADASPAMGAQAFATGNATAFAAMPDLHTAAHEAAHVVQQRGGVQLKDGVGQAGDRYEQHADAVADRVVRGESAQALLDELAGGGAIGGSAPIQRKVEPKNVAVEMVGREFILTADDGGLKSGATVIPTAWDNAADTVPVKAAGKGTATAVHKVHLRPKSPGTAGMDEYHAGVADQAHAVEAGDKKVADWRAREKEYAKNHKLWEKELARLEELAARKHEVLNQKLIQETQFNRFDPIIKKEVDAANTAAGLTGKAKLDPNLLKSMIFQESQMGTSGQHLEEPASHPVKSRFNVGQAIDSSGMILLTLMEKEHTALVAKFHLGTLREDLETAQTRKGKLEKQAKRTPDEDKELAVLQGQSKQNWEQFIWGYHAPGQADGFAKAVGELFASPGAGKPARNLDYEFWIHTMVLWLFEKKKSVKTWEEAIRAYNGSGHRAEAYKNAVTGRRDKAHAAAGAGTSFVPGGI